VMLGRDVGSEPVMEATHGGESMRIRANRRRRRYEGGGKRLAADVRDERGAGDARLPARLGSAQAQVVVLEVARAERLVEAADRRHDLTPCEQAEADEPRRGQCRSARDRGRIGDRVAGVVLDELRAGDAVRAWADEPDAR